ncbi:membrane-spanning 4-domains subfamily A member 6A isoform X1 [Fukomys damarensis]|uniref:membrane-spanning 4-domains subfamily A member 6A isoform X1 n=1 Tax=Fukomys damarensis TaxID=885580 RepID=UPI0005402D90|nr:membrane-spanning 4-domains subfamily A member 6A isoform X1 [Fukomys damarensis]
MAPVTLVQNLLRADGHRDPIRMKPHHCKQQTKGLVTCGRQKSGTIDRKAKSLSHSLLETRRAQHQRAEPLAQTIQILCGVMVLSFGIILAAAPDSPHFTTVFYTLIKSAYPFLGSLCFIVSGCLSIITEKKSTKSLVRSSLACSILSTVLALVGVALISYTLAALESSLQQCELSRLSGLATQSYFYFHHEDYSDCLIAKASVTGALSLMLLCSVLELCLAVLTAVLLWKQAQSDFPGIVLFQPHSHKNNTNIFSKTHGNPGYEELMTA